MPPARREELQPTYMKTALPVLAYFLGARISVFVLVLVLVIVIVLEKTNSHNHEEHSRARMTDHNTGGYILTTSLHVKP